MALSDSELHTAYESLSKAARNCGLGWAVEQVEDTIALGKTTVQQLSSRTDTEPLRTDPSSSTDYTAKAPATRATFVVAEAYSPAENLDLLIDAVLMAVPTAHDVAQHALTGIREFGRVDSLVFISDLPSSEPRELHSTALESRRQSVLLVEKLLKQLKAEIHDAS